MEGAIPLSIASYEGHVDLRRLLIENSSYLDKSEDDGATPLYCACENGHAEVARLCSTRAPTSTTPRTEDVRSFSLRARMAT
mmetsp:Transcript_10256/g.30958  ORF Transcript_10256/g.30958 Transcript_10256/m.30958 type:complete len:82 (+) Transcript_10256:406-651(+)